MTRSQTGAFACTALLAAALGCAGGSAHPSHDSTAADGSAAGDASDGLGLPRASTVLSLTPDQGAHLCDWINQQEGGYGVTVNCSTGPMATNKTQAECVSGLPVLQTACPSLTVGVLEDCYRAIGTDLCMYSAAPACAPLVACFCVP